MIDNSRRMAYDEDLAELVRELLADEPDLTEKRMFCGPGEVLIAHDPIPVFGQHRDNEPSGSGRASTAASKNPT